MATEVKTTDVALGITPRLDHRGFPFITDDQRRAQRKAWIELIDHDAVIDLALRHYGGKAGGRIVGHANGSFNVCFFIELDDDDASANDGMDRSDHGEKSGVKWVVRIPITPSLRGEDPWPRLQSEVATMRYLEKHTRIPIPHVHGFGNGARLLKEEGTTASVQEDEKKDSKADETQSYLIMDFVEGEKVFPSKLRDLDTKTRRNFLSQMVDILADLRTLEFPVIGSLLLNNDNADNDEPPKSPSSSLPAQGPLHFLPNEPLFLPDSLPPFSSARDYIRFRYRMMSVAFEEPYRDHTLEDIRHELFAVHHLEAAYEDVAAGRVPSAIPWSPSNGSVSATKHETIPNVKNIASGVAKDDSGPFILTHTDMNTFNILIDDKWNIKAVIDWESAYTVPKCVFTPPAWITGHCGTFDRHELPKWQRVHAEFRELLAEKAQTSSVCETLQKEWYGAAEDEDALDRVLSLAECLRCAPEASHSFYSFFAPECMRRSLDRAAWRAERKTYKQTWSDLQRGFFEQHAALAAEAQRRADNCARYTAYLKDNDLYETEEDRLLAKRAKLIKDLRAKYPNMDHGLS
ncbi:hypothetical protein SBRCBS47491_008974 [Sporothrix bragantina]|uniref:Aminoglycoside phosphotransferase domain-containing protein n=1 Tax=Sporothrix bragantina TaxID=671064 RepID=A0ABP0CRT6_9PEZI